MVASRVFFVDPSSVQGKGAGRFIDVIYRWPGLFPKIDPSLALFLKRKVNLESIHLVWEALDTDIRFSF